MLLLNANSLLIVFLFIVCDNFCEEGGDFYAKKTFRFHSVDSWIIHYRWLIYWLFLLCLEFQSNGLDYPP